MAELGFNIVISVLLLATIAYSITLSRKLTNLQKTKGELQHFLLEFDRSIQAAEQHISTLKALSQAADKSLKDQIEKARFLANDLSFLGEKGEAIADTLEVKIDQYKSLEQKEQQHARKASPAAMSPMKKQGAGGAATARKDTAKTPAFASNHRAEDEKPMPAEMVMAKAALSKGDKASKQKAIEQLLQQIQSNKTPSKHETVVS